jgi:hypothetical protein
MAESNVHRFSVAVWLMTAAAGAAVLILADVSVVTLVTGAAAITAGQLISVPAPSGERLYLGIGVASAMPLLVADPAAVAAIYAFGMVGSWVVFAVRREESVVLSSHFVSEALSLASFGFVFYLTLSAAESLAVSDDWAELLALAVGGVVWYATRAFLRSLVGLERVDLSVRYLWLLALEDWSAIVTMLIAGGLFGFAWPVMRWWALPVTILPYAFSHTAFVRYHSTRVTYGQTIRALAQIPEVAGLAPRGHSSRTADLAVAVARELGMHPDDVTELEYAALVHDIGRITLNEPAILRAGYTDEDIARWGAQIVAEAPHLERVAELVREQYRPYRQAGQERDPDVPLASQIIKVVSAYDKARSEMSLSPVDALEQVHRGSTYDFDPDVTASLRRVLVHRRDLDS